LKRTNKTLGPTSLKISTEKD